MAAPFSFYNLKPKVGFISLGLFYEAVAQYLLTAPAHEDPAAKIVALGSGKADDFSVRHDDYIIEHIKSKSRR
ncbi:MAG: hypothetical protein GX766_00635 [Firmicutes bacterium]|nr:hypothetical protein [Bacillota bacterium]HOB21838.1 hypothetical protein [Bacillota bacterium]HQD40781.1 hypothetical protein [Bacillota bacterium]